MESIAQNNDGIPKSSAAGSLAPFSPFGLRFVEAISCPPDCEASLPKLRNLLRMALGIMLILAVATFFSNSWYEAIAISPRPIRLFNIAFTLLAIGAIPFVSRRSWRVFIFSYFVVLMLSYTIAALSVHDEEPLFVAMLVLLLDTALIIPWGGRWQVLFALFNVACFLTIASAGLIRVEDIPDWIALETVSLLCVSLAMLKVFLGRQQNLIIELSSREERLRDENLRRIRAEERSQAEIVERETAEKLARGARRFCARSWKPAST